MGFATKTDGKKGWGKREEALWGKVKQAGELHLLNVFTSLDDPQRMFIIVQGVTVNRGLVPAFQQVLRKQQFCGGRSKAAGVARWHR